MFSSVATEVALLDPLKIIESTAEPVFGTDEEDRLVIWNGAAAELLGYRAEQVLGKSCYELLCGTDSFGNRFCDEHCSIANMIARRESVNRFPLTFRRSDGRPVSVWLTIISVPGPKPTQHTVLHIMTPASAPSQTDATDFPGQPAPWSSLPQGAESSEVDGTSPLTARETEVLQLLAQGTSTSDIADALFISVTTVRSHTQNILGKLDCHSKLEAVAVALRRRLI